jgi:hypothetical protein
MTRKGDIMRTKWCWLRWTFGLLLLALPACKWAFLEQEVAAEREIAAGDDVLSLELRRIKEAATEHPSLSVDLDERGNPVAGLELQLDWFPPAKPGQATLPACLPPLDPEAEVGLWRCIESAEAPKPLKAGMLSQVCDVVEGERVKRGASMTMSAPGCTQLAVYAHQFAPELRIVHALRP